MSYSDTVLDLGYDYGAQGGPEFSVTTTVTGGGAERSNLDWAQPKGEWQIGDRTGERCLDLEEYQYLYNFWMARRGSFEGFSYKDWGDFELIDEVIGVGDGVKTQFQVTKTYGSFVRVIKKLNPAGFSWQVDNKGVTGQLDPLTGLLTLGSAAATGTLLKVTGEFWCSVKFVENKWPGKFHAADAYTGQRFYELGSLQLRGIRV